MSTSVCLQSPCRILLRALQDNIDTATPTGRAVAAIMATLAELELELGRERRAASASPAAPATCPLGVESTRVPSISNKIDDRETATTDAFRE